jgi:hypothetical protein
LQKKYNLAAFYNNSSPSLLLPLTNIYLPFR